MKTAASAPLAAHKPMREIDGNVFLRDVCRFGTGDIVNVAIEDADGTRLFECLNYCTAASRGWGVGANGMGGLMSEEAPILPTGCQLSAL
jgi:hypothetical protein